MARPTDPGRTQAILDAANAIIDEGGFEDMRMSDVAKRAGMAVGTLYLYFPSKHDIMRALGAQLFNRAAEFLLPAFEQPLDRAGIDAMVESLLILVDDDRELFRVVSRIATDASTPYTVAARQQLVNRLAESLERQARAGTVRAYPDTVALADYVVMLIRRAAMVVSTEEEGGRERYAPTLALLLENALLPAPAREARRPAARPEARKRRPTSR